MRAWMFRHAVNCYPPYLFTGIRVTRVTSDYRELDVAMPLRFYNRNYVGTHFGGSLYSMADPFLMIMLMKNLGPDYVVWDRSASIDFIRPGKSRVSAGLRLDEELLDSVRRQTRQGDKAYPEFEIEVLDSAQQVVARVKKKLYVRKKRHLKV